ncbi:hypothetical protein [Dinghuibacter silviterrae]|uniref:Outer membrane beta-barrel porin/alpha-amylase n=1 Tax=Dinghuibacter silviterrae TaxID=1539049 RepID=A0A4R8DIV8_9BACT|nr:hypothetical protein [Dinghuibacter silviterrae]TDW97497.1 hypothetical protein EDB95_5347 [Dinghuibacter silviterrae]
MKSTFLRLLIALLPLWAQAQHTYSTEMHPKTWRFNSGFDVGAWWGGTGVAPLDPKTNTLVQSHLMHQTAYSGDIYLEWLHKKNKPGRIGPDIGIKTKLVWDYFTANNGGDGNGQESLTLNYINVPVLFEYCISFKNKVTSPSYTAGSSNSYTYVYDHGYYYHVITTTTTTPGHYNPGGIPYTNAIFVYAGPQICYLAKGFHSLNGTEAVDTDPALTKSYAGFIGGFCFYLANLNIDISYQRGLTSICTGKNVYVSGCLFRVGFNLTRRKF